MRTQCHLPRRRRRLPPVLVEARDLYFLSLQIAVHAELAPDKDINQDKEEMIVPVTFYIPGALREFTAGRSKVEIESSPTTLADALSVLWTLYPGVRDRIATEQGQVREHVNIFIGNENARYTGGLASPIPPGSEISIVPAVSGG